MITTIILSLLVGVFLGYVVRQVLASRKVKDAESSAEKILESAKNKEKEMLLEAKTRALEMTEQAKKAEMEFRAQIVRFEERLDRREKDLDSKLTNLDKQKAVLEQKEQDTVKIQEEIKEIKAKQLASLEKIAAMTREEAGKVLLENAEKLIGHEQERDDEAGHRDDLKVKIPIFLPRRRKDAKEKIVDGICRELHFAPMKLLRFQSRSINNSACICGAFNPRDLRELHFFCVFCTPLRFQPACA
jgi:ribonuclease Y